MRYDGTNLEEVLEAHKRWYNEEGDDIRDEDRADFSDCDCIGINLRGALLWGADMRNCDLRYADLRGCDLTRADLTGVNWFKAMLQEMRLRAAKNVPYVPLGCPDTGSFIAWKKAIFFPADAESNIDCYDENKHVREYAIVKLRIPEDAERSTDLNGECRANKAEVLEIQKLDGTVLADAHNKDDAFAISIKDNTFLYRVGTTLTLPRMGGDRFYNMAPGIYFYINRMDAVQYLTDGTDGFGRQESMERIKDYFREVDKNLKVDRWEAQ